MRKHAAIAVGWAALVWAAATGAQAQAPHPKLTPAQIEAIKRQNAEAQAANALITVVRNAMAAKDWQAAIGPLDQLIAAHPTEWAYYATLGDAQYNLARYDEAADAYSKGIAAADHVSDPAKAASVRSGKAKMLTNLGNAQLKLKRPGEALAAYQAAAVLDPNPGVAYFNLCAILYNTGNVAGALGACEKSIAADPKRADAYFIKGSLLIADSTVGPDKSLQAPPGAVEALRKYLELAPSGPHAADVREMLAAVGAKVTTTYEGKK
jgi:tetratricopeptide (TPR) repeat protein